MQQTANYDESWKEALSEYFEPFLSFFFPSVHQLIDWKQVPQSLDKELQQITASAKTKKRFADKLYQVWLLDGRLVWILIHIEVQSQQDSDFSQRMYIYNYRAFDLYHKPVVSLAILGDERVSWRPNGYDYNLGGCRVSLEFPVVKLLDYEEQWSELESDQNPFATLVMAHLKTKETTGNPKQRQKWKWSLVRGLYDRGLEREQIIKLFQIIDRMMTLPNPLQESLDQKIKQFEEERTMPLLSNMELRGIEIGALQNARDYIKTILSLRFGAISSDVQDFLDQSSDLGLLEEILKLAVTVNSLADFQQSLPQVNPNNSTNYGATNS